MRIAQVAPQGIHAYSGQLTAMVSLARALARRGHQVELWQLHDWPREHTGALEDQLRAAGAEIVRIPVGARLPGGEARRAVARRGVDLVHLHGVFNRMNPLLARSLPVPYVIGAHGGYSAPALAYHRWRKLAFLRAFELPMLHGAACFLALTEQEVEQVRGLGFRGRVEVVPNGVDPPPDGVDPQALRRELGIGPGAPLLVYTGRIDTGSKGLDVLLRALAQVPGWRAVLVGPDFRGRRAESLALAADLRLGDRVRFLDARRGRALHEVLAAGDLYALLSRWEGMPLSLLEALAHGLPALVSPAVESIVGVQESGAGWVADGEEGVAARLQELLEPADHLARARAAARRLAARYDWDEVARRYEQAAERALAGS